MLIAREVRSARLAIIDLETNPWTRPLIVATRARGPVPPHAMAFVAALRALSRDGGSQADKLIPPQH
jgi:hypothetical protein